MYKDRKCGDCKHYRLQLEGSGDQQQTSVHNNRKKTKKQNTSKHISSDSTLWKTTMGGRRIKLMCLQDQDIYQ
jgi:hypothetical protein